ncbi:MAG: L-glyceraldehyde 3-phosphate reductase [Fibrobacteres bacterium]|nr:L-glyceraldehyde 3-phosphate reductase [Fibrobacterota bacterium]
MYKPRNERYDGMTYRRCGRSGLKLSALSLGLWHNFGEPDNFNNMQSLLFRAFDLGITHFDLANNYGPPPGSAETHFGRILKSDLGQYRDEMVISTKAGYRMWTGPYGDNGSRKYLISSLDQSLTRMGLDYVDIFYHHRPDYETPLEETMSALNSIVRQGKALYVGLSNYKPDEFLKASRILRELGTPCLIHQPSYSILNRWIEPELLKCLDTEGVGCIPFSPLAQGILSDKYLKGIPADSRASKSHTFLKPDRLTPELLAKIEKLNGLATQRGQSLAQMAVAWILRHQGVTSVLIGASKTAQLEDNLAALKNLSFSADELTFIDNLCPIV